MNEELQKKSNNKPISRNQRLKAYVFWKIFGFYPYKYRSCWVDK